jgi:cell division transport system permease protein
MRSLCEALAGFRRTPLLGALSISAISLSLVIMGLFGLSAHNIGSAISDIERRVEVVGYLLEEMGPDQVHVAQQEIEAFPEIESVFYVSKKEALENAQRDLPEFSDVYEELHVNPLPASLHLRLKPGFRTPESLQIAAEYLRGYDFVEEVRFGEGWVEQLFTIRRIAGGVSAILGGAFAIVAILLIFTSVEIAILARSEEIEIMQTIGAKDRYVQFPLIIEGFIKGLLGGLIALGLTRLTYESFRYRVEEFDSLVWLPNTWVVGGLLTACAIGMVSAAVSVQRELGRAYAA